MCPVSAGGSLPVRASGDAGALIPAPGIWSLTEISADGPPSSAGLRAPISCLRNAPIAISKAAQTTSGGVSTAKSPDMPRPPFAPAAGQAAAASARGTPRQAPLHCHAPDLARLRRGQHAELRIRTPAWQYRTPARTPHAGQSGPPLFHADLHIHSRFSRACSRDCDIEHLA